MSWDSYIDNLVGQSADGTGANHIDRGTIIGLQGGAPWVSGTAATHLKLAGTEGATIANVMGSKDFTPFQTSGLLLEGVKYQFLRSADDRTCLFKKKDHGSLTVSCSKTAIVIGHCPEGSQQGQANKAVGVIRDYLESLNM